MDGRRLLRRVGLVLILAPAIFVALPLWILLGIAKAASALARCRPVPCPRCGSTLEDVDCPYHDFCTGWHTIYRCSTCDVHLSEGSRGWKEEAFCPRCSWLMHRHRDESVRRGQLVHACVRCRRNWRREDGNWVEVYPCRR